MEKQKTGTGHTAHRDARLQRAHRRVGLSAAALVIAMVGMSYAAVPLYQIFCQVTGYGGTTQRAVQAPDKILDRKITVRFDANVARNVPWRFKPAKKTVELRIGESTLAYYVAENLSSESVRGTASFNVTPEAAGYYFNKIECFCFTEQVLKPGQRVDMPVTFYIDPDIVNDPEARNITEITLSYTFFRSEKESDGKPGLASVAKSGVKDGS